MLEDLRMWILHTVSFPENDRNEVVTISLLLEFLASAD
jgi:hypothetical protein